MRLESRSVHRPDGSRRRWGLAALCLARCLIVIDNTILNVVLPTLRRGFSVPLVMAAFVAFGRRGHRVPPPRAAG